MLSQRQEMWGVDEKMHKPLTNLINNVSFYMCGY
ncbi:Uncharacterised protein [Serratia rubidaea]|uniref:Uncharacterized protein n=1 Tax=Serratia rubidaea TaxID=61652 RepID=A0A4U9HHB8_SERRU|nr:Uncharacterised protein [Serratia rubidaea]